MAQQDRPDRINQLPNEILALIMELFVYEPDLQKLVNDQKLSPGLTQYFLPPLVYKADRISFVCRRWRDIALNTPRLWSQIHLSWPNCAVSTYFSRSGSVPLSLAMNKRSFIRTTTPWKDREDSQAMTPFKHIVKSLTASNSFHRIDRLSIEWRHHVSAFTVQDLLISPNLILYELSGTTHLPLLSDVCFYSTSIKSTFPSPCSNASSSDIIRFLESCPLLETVILICGSVNKDTVSYDEEDHASGEFISPNDVTYTAGSPPSSVDPEITLPTPLLYLKSLRLAQDQKPFTEKILNSFTFPSSASVILSINFSKSHSFISALPSPLLNVLPLSHTLSIRIDSSKSTVALNLDFKAHSYPQFAIELLEHPDWELSRVQERDLRIKETEVFFDSLTRLPPFTDLSVLGLSVRYIPSLKAKTISSFLAHLPCLDRLSVRTPNANPIITALGTSSRILNTKSYRNSNNMFYSLTFPAPKLHIFDIRKSRFSPTLLERMLLDRDQWVAEMEEIKVTRGWSLRSWKDKDGRRAEEVLRSLKGDVCELEDGCWTDNSVDLEDDEKEDSEEEEEESEESEVEDSSRPISDEERL
ncbi:hypothetical protein SISNIDRAFT_453150 [Sistotremastrum niveocremeum HHB9708]|uniref:Uncharacterized protein n=1 Tax=Sistotremastrum niveocremeum HHB9708 TaxID=1314777 RepID=A0A164WEX8_9AGAM|nr:hypothetical protein SISNIDRAFT_453150 [Sistotremastrum niveocremeum HHB9708]